MLNNCAWENASRLQHIAENQGKKKEKEPKRETLWPSPDKLLQISLSRNSQHKFALHICDDCKILLLSLLPIRASIAFKEPLQLLQRRLHGDNLVCAAFSVEALHRSRNSIRFLNRPRCQELLQPRNAKVSEKRAVRGRGNGEMCVVAFECREECGGYRGARGDG